MQRKIPDLVTMTNSRGRRDRRGLALLIACVGVGVMGYGVSLMPDRGIIGARSVPVHEPIAQGFEQLNARSAVSSLPETGEPKDSALRGGGNPGDKVLADARRLIVGRRFDEALATLDEARELLKPRAEAYLLMGKALEGKRDFGVARDFYNAALERDPWLSDAHWGYATTSEALGDLESALGGMRSYLHTETDPDPKRLRVNQARSAIWEWETRLGRGPWGPTRGIPPGFVESDLKRDGRGVGVKWPRLETLQPDGRMKSEIKSAEKIQIYPRP